MLGTSGGVRPFLGRRRFLQTKLQKASNELTLFPSTGKTCFLQSLEYPLQVLQVFFEGLGIYIDIVQVDEDKPSYVISEDRVHDTLKGSGRIGQPEWHDVQFKRPELSDERGLLFVFLYDCDLPVTRGQIERGNHCASVRESKMSSMRGRGYASFRAVVHTKAELSVLLGNQYHLGRPRAARGSDQSIGKHISDLILYV